MNYSFDYCWGEPDEPYGNWDHCLSEPQTELGLCLECYRKIIGRDATEQERIACDG